MLFGSAYLPSAVDNRPWLVKLDAGGNTVWSSENGLTQQVTVDSAIVRGFERADGSLVFMGDTTGYPNVDLYLLKGGWDAAGGGLVATHWGAYCGP